MSRELVMKLVRGENIEEKDINEALYDICDRVHSGCHEECPVFEKNGGVPWNKEYEECLCFKDGKKMRKFLTKE